MRNTIAVFKNQVQEFKADKEQLIIFILFPAMAFFQTRMVELDDGVYPYQIVTAVAGMFVSSIVIMVLPQIIAEHRENGSLRFMVMSGIKPTSYLLGLGGFFLVICMAVALFMAWLGEFTGPVLVNFLLVMLVGLICSTLLAAIIGIVSKNRQKAMGVAMPLGFMIAFLPMLAEMLEPLQSILDLLFVERINHMMIAIHTGDFLADLYVVLGNIAVLTALFAVLFKWKGLKA